MTVHLGDAQWAQFRSRIIGRSLPGPPLRAFSGASLWHLDRGRREKGGVLCGNGGGRHRLGGNEFRDLHKAV